jgi:uncharacterized protein
MNIILDTNVFISGIFWEGNFCSQIINAWRDKKFILVSSIPIIDELTNTLKDFKIKMPENLIREWRNLIIKNSIIVDSKIKLNITKHEEDNKFIEIAISGNADYIISQDKHLLEIKEYKEIKIITPEEFLKILNK